MSARTAEARPASLLPSGEIRAIVASLRRRLAWERLLRSCLRGLIAGLLTVVAVGLGTWIDGFRLSVPLALGILVAGPVVGALLAIVRWPSTGHAARVADRRLRLDERLATALELAEVGGGAGRLASLQMADAARGAQTARARWPSLLDQVGREAVLAAALACLAAGVAVLLTLEVPPIRPRAATRPADVPTAAPTAEADLPPPPPLPVQRQAQPSSPINQDPATAQQRADALRQAQQAQARRQALSQLGQALRSGSATQGAAQAIDQGDYRSAADQLSGLGEEADQLSAAAKAGLSRALGATASQTTANPALANAERRAADALSRNDYVAQRDAMRQLGAEVAREGANLPSQADAARELGRTPQSSPGSSQNAGGQQPEVGGAQTDSTGAQAGAASQDSQSDGQAGSGGASGDQAGGPGAGTGASDGQPGPQAPRLATVGQRVEVPAELGRGSADRPATPGGAPPSGSEAGDGVRTTVDVSRTQQVDQVAPEQNLVPGARRSIVRGYFGNGTP